MRRMGRRRLSDIEREGDGVKSVGNKHLWLFYAQAAELWKKQCSRLGAAQVGKRAVSHIQTCKCACILMSLLFNGSYSNSDLLFDLTHCFRTLAQ